MDFQTSVRRCLTEYATFSGRASRSEFWWFALFGAVARIIAGILDRILFGPSTFAVNPANGHMTMHFHPGYLGILVGLGLIIPSLAVGSRRMHDIGKSGWWQALSVALLLAIIPIIGWLIALAVIILLIYWFVQPSEGPNSYGEGPEGAGSPA